ncbi:hypothetical protein OW492_14180 [Psychromonas sp. 14N.309.X.WAT.B.A12]|uniref:hypothetical protein n=1 Tax=Psychromonas sp. 14N.309.X.WAT.B.A12 TaxID=2998322 RepID=UPI0025B25CA1|nr:hypothetical protein [Psychromonas sp. 14N.309.X.WAT.B.A12]MDN2664522.1 hypothetical protein [Psychromonas sp. 14N.309.X.WAT.B.A12]
MKILPIFSWAVVVWIAKVFLLSLPYKFTLHPDTQHIFGTIGAWMQGFLGDTIGSLFANYGSYAVGSVELITSLVLLSPIVFWILKKVGVLSCAPSRSLIHAIGGLMASGVMAGATFFHLFTPLGIEVIHEGKSDGGSLFYAAVSILILGLILFVANYRDYKSKVSQ